MQWLKPGIAGTIRAGEAIAIIILWVMLKRVNVAT